MHEFETVSEIEIEKSFTDNDLKISRVISLTLVAGPFIFLVLTIFMYLKNMEMSGKSFPVDEFLIYFLLFLTITTYPIFLFFPKFFTKPKILSQQLSNLNNTIMEPTRKIIHLERVLMIIRLAMLEGVTIFAFVILFIVVREGQINNNPSLWYLIIPWVIQAIYTFSNFVRRESYINRMLNLFVNKTT